MGSDGFSAESCGTLWGMDKDQHAGLLRHAMAFRRKSRDDIAEVTGKSVRTVTNWTTGRTMPSDAERILLRELLGDYDALGDPVELAIRKSMLTEDRQYDVIGYYKRRMREQDEATRPELPLFTPAGLSDPTPSLRSVANKGDVEPDDGDLDT